MVTPVPLVLQYGEHAVYCPNPRGGRTSVGCAVASTASVLRHFGKALPMVGSEVDLKALGQSMGDRHRQRDPRSPHGRCPRQWCALCSYLELKARGVPVGYGRLTWAQIEAHARRGHPVVMPIRYGTIPLVRADSYGPGRPATGRSDSYLGGHMVTLYGIRGDTAIVADSDFGSPGRRRIPPHSEIPLATLRRAWQDFGSSHVAYATAAPNGARTAARASKPGISKPDTPNPPPPPPDLPFGAALSHRGKYRVAVPAGQHANLRSSPRMLDDNIIRKLDPGTTFSCGMTTLAGTNVKGNARWHGTADGKRWLHSSVVRAVGKRDGTEDIR